MRFNLFLACVTLVWGMTAPTKADLLEPKLWFSGPAYSGEVPACASSHALGLIRHRFASKERRYWDSNLRIEDISDIREVASNPWQGDHIPRRWCTGKALLSDGQWRTVDYVIGEDTGLMGIVAGVDWCVQGLDRNWAFSPDCKRAKP